MTTEARVRGEELLKSHRYGEARAAFEAAISDADDPDALFGLATACRVLDDIPAATEALERAYRLHLRVGDRSAAARDAVGLADLAVEYHGAGSVAQGWLHRALQHLADTPEDATHVHVAGLLAYLALAYDKDPATAREHAHRALEVAERVGDQVAVTLGNAYLGLIEVSLGEVAVGMKRLEGSAAAATAGELPPEDALDAYCLLLTACERVRDVERVHEWAGFVLSEAEREGSDSFAAFARTQYAGALLLRGEYDAADRELERVLQASEDRPLAAAMGLVLRSRLRCRQGRLDEADELLSVAEREPYRRAVRHLVVATRAALEELRGEHVVAADLAERYLQMVSASDVIERVEALETLVRARLGLGDTERASVAAEELESIAVRIPTAGLRGAAVLAQGLVSRAAGEFERAVGLLERAVEEYDAGGLAYDNIDARIELGHAYVALGRTEAARREVEIALDDARSIGATGFATGAQRLLATLRGGPPVGGLTVREAEVLTLAGVGLANHEIAERLTLSVRTVERHLSNVYLKVGATGPAARSVAIAFGRSHGLF